MSLNKDTLSLEDRIACAIEECIEYARQHGTLYEDDAYSIAENWTIDDLEDEEYLDGEEDPPDLGAILEAVIERFGF